TAVRGVVLLSDGRQVGGDTTVPSALASGGVPIHTVRVAPRDALKDASIIRLIAPPSAFVGETIKVRAELRAVGLPSTQADVAFAALDAAQWDAVNRLVRDRGGAVILVAGDAHLPAEYFQSPAAAALLPYMDWSTTSPWRTPPGDRPSVHVIPTTFGAHLDA